MKILKEENHIVKGKYRVNLVGQTMIKLVGSLKGESSKIIYIHNKQLRITPNKRCKI